MVKELKQLEEKSEPVTKLFQDEEFLEKAQTSRSGKIKSFYRRFGRPNFDENTAEKSI